MIPALGAGGPGFKPRNGPNPFGKLGSLPDWLSRGMGQSWNLLAFAKIGSQSVCFLVTNWYKLHTFSKELGWSASERVFVPWTEQPPASRKLGCPSDLKIGELMAWFVCFWVRLQSDEPRWLGIAIGINYNNRESKIYGTAFCAKPHSKRYKIEDTSSWRQTMPSEIPIFCPLQCPIGHIFWLDSKQDDLVALFGSLWNKNKPAAMKCLNRESC